MPLHAQVQALMAAMAENPRPKTWESTPEEAREGYTALAELIGPGPEVASVDDFEVPGPAGPIPVRWYTPEGNGPHPVVVFMHGGGWVIGDLDTHDHCCRRICVESGAAVLAVHYRLAPEHRWPAAVDDSWAALQWVAANADSRGGDGSRLAVVGDSAGGNLAAVMALRARDAGGPSLAQQILVYPVVDLSFSRPSYVENGEGYILEAKTMEWFVAHYLGRGRADGGDDLVHPDIAPLAVDDLGGLAPALVVTAEFDPLRDEGEAYAARLIEAGVPTVAQRYDGMVHAFFQLPGVLDAGTAVLEQVAETLRKAFAAA
ncbi:MAG: alpha/beta hydrolase [Actinomycetia bacterium]|nr:alpha/beta hydrolase [Actinomycetes bacterium]